MSKLEMETIKVQVKDPQFTSLLFLKAKLFFKDSQKYWQPASIIFVPVVLIEEKKSRTFFFFSADANLMLCRVKIASKCWFNTLSSSFGHLMNSATGQNVGIEFLPDDSIRVFKSKIEEILRQFDTPEPLKKSLKPYKNSVEEYHKSPAAVTIYMALGHEKFFTVEFKPSFVMEMIQKLHEKRIARNEIQDAARSVLGVTKPLSKKHPVVRPTGVQTPYRVAAISGKSKSTLALTSRPSITARSPSAQSLGLKIAEDVQKIGEDARRAKWKKAVCENFVHRHKQQQMGLVSESNGKELISQGMSLPEQTASSILEVNEDINDTKDDVQQVLCGSLKKSLSFEANLQHNIQKIDSERQKLKIDNIGKYVKALSDLQLKHEKVEETLNHMQMKRYDTQRGIYQLSAQLSTLVTDLIETDEYPCPCSTAATSEFSSEIADDFSDDADDSINEDSVCSTLSREIVQEDE